MPGHGERRTPPAGRPGGAFRRTLHRPGVAQRSFAHHASPVRDPARAPGRIPAPLPVLASSTGRRMRATERLKRQGLVSTAVRVRPYPLSPNPTAAPVAGATPAPAVSPPTGPPSTLWNIGPVATGPMFHRAQRNLVKPADTDPGHSISVTAT